MAGPVPLPEYETSEQQVEDAWFERLQAVPILSSLHIRTLVAEAASYEPQIRGVVRAVERALRARTDSDSRFSVLRLMDAICRTHPRRWAEAFSVDIVKTFCKAFESCQTVDGDEEATYLKLLQLWARERVISTEKIRVVCTGRRCGDKGQGFLSSCQSCAPSFTADRNIQGGGGFRAVEEAWFHMTTWLGRGVMVVLLNLSLTRVRLPAVDLSVRCQSS